MNFTLVINLEREETFSFTMRLNTIGNKLFSTVLAYSSSKGVKIIVSNWNIRVHSEGFAPSKDADPSPLERKKNRKK